MCIRDREEVAQRLALALVQAVLLHQHVAADDLFAAFAHLLSLIHI